MLFSTPQAYSQAEDIQLEGIPLPARFATADFSSTNSPFIGAWFGKWDNSLASILIIEAISATDQITATYAIASNAQRGTQASWHALTGTLSDHQMQLGSEHFSLQATLSRNGKLKAVFAGDSGFAVFQRQNLSNIVKANAPVQWSSAQQVMLPTPLQEDQQPIELEATVYSPPGDGPFPLAVFNHGSTGSGTEVWAEIGQPLKAVRAKLKSTQPPNLRRMSSRSDELNPVAL